MAAPEPLGFIARERADELDVDEFRRKYEEPNLPVLLTGVSDSWPANAMWTKEVCPPWVVFGVPALAPVACAREVCFRGLCRREHHRLACAASEALSTVSSPAHEVWRGR